MDSEHRHELQENMLARWLGPRIEAIQPHLPTIILGFVGAMAATMAWNYYKQTSSEADEVSWQAYSIAMDTGASERSLLALEQVGEDHADSPAAAWAAVTWADGQLMMATGSYLTNRTFAEEALAKATDKYEALLADTSTDKIVRDRAHFGMAKLKELTGDIEGAREHYGQVGGAFEELASARAEALADEKIQADVEWLASAESAPRRPQFGVPGSTGQLDATPDPIELPADEPAFDGSFSDLLKKIEGMEPAEESGSDTPAVEDSSEAAGEDGDSDDVTVTTSEESEAADSGPAETPATE